MSRKKHLSLRRAFLGAVVVFSAAQTATAASLRSFVSEKLQEFGTGSTCDTSTSGTIESLAQLCGLNSSSVNSNFSRRAAEDLEDDLFFQALAKKRVDRIQCARGHLRTLLGKGSTQERLRIATDLERKITVLRKLQRELDQLNFRLSKSYGGVGPSTGKAPTSQDYKAMFQDVQRLDKKRDQLALQVALLRESVWMGDHVELQKFIDREMRPPQFRGVDVINRILARNGEFDSLLKRVEKSLEAEETHLKSLSSGGPTARSRLKDGDKIQLLRDHSLVGEVAGRLPPDVWKGLQCRMNARYGDGREKFRAVGILTMTGASLALPIASGVGLISSQSARIMIAANLGGAAASSLYDAYDKQCRDRAYYQFRDYNRCDSLDRTPTSAEAQGAVETESNCALGLALASLDVPTAEIKVLVAGFGAVRALPRVRQVLLHPKKPNQEKIEARIFPVSEPGNSRVDLRMERATDGEELGRIEYQIGGKNGDELRIDSISVPEDFEMRGVSTELIREAIETHPNIRKIRSYLREDNAEAVEKALREGLDLNEAVKASPAYKARKKLGFGHIESVKKIPKGPFTYFEVVVHREI